MHNVPKLLPVEANAGLLSVAAFAMSQSVADRTRASFSAASTGRAESGSAFWVAVKGGGLIYE